jgi:hypothetical protein
MQEIVPPDMIPFLNAWCEYGTCRRVKKQKGKPLLVFYHRVGPKQLGNLEWEADFHPFLDTSHPCLMLIAGYPKTGRCTVKVPRSIIFKSLHNDSFFRCCVMQEAVD